MDERNLPVLGGELPSTVSSASFLQSNIFNQLVEVSKFLAGADLIPMHFRGKAANVFVALEFALRMQMSPFAVMQNIYVVYGRPSIEGKLAIALINQSGKYDGPLQYDIERDKAGKIVSCTAWAMQKGVKVPGVPVTAEMVAAEKWDADKDVWKEGKVIGKQLSKWRTMPEMMFRYRAGTYFARVNCPEVLMGLQTTEELHDVIALTPNAEGVFGLGAEESESESEEEKDAFASEEAMQLKSIMAEADWSKVQQFVCHCSEVYKLAIPVMIAKALGNAENFMAAFRQWFEGLPKENKPPRTRRTKEQIEADEKAKAAAKEAERVAKAGVAMGQDGMLKDDLPESELPKMNPAQNELLDIAVANGKSWDDVKKWWPAIPYASWEYIPPEGIQEIKDFLLGRGL